MTEPYRDPDGPIQAVLAAANTVAPRCHLPDGVSLVHARYQYPACAPEGTRRSEVVGWSTGAPVEVATDVVPERERRAKKLLDAAKRRTRRDVAGVIT